MPPKKVVTGAAQTRSQKGKEQEQVTTEEKTPREGDKEGNEEGNPSDGTGQTGLTGQANPQVEGEGRIDVTRSGESNPNQEGGAEQQDKKDNPSANQRKNDDKGEGLVIHLSNPDEESDDDNDEGEHEHLRESDVELLLREQHQHFVEELAKQQREQRHKHEEELAQLRLELQNSATETHSNHVQPPQPQGGQPEAGAHQAEVGVKDLLPILQALQAEVAGLKRMAPQPSQEDQPPTARIHTDALSTPA
ncbi:hypothetical protein KEM55_003483, partial [Ascosphaera atra]